MRYFIESILTIRERSAISIVFIAWILLFCSWTVAGESQSINSPGASNQAPDNISFLPIQLYNLMAKICTKNYLDNSYWEGREKVIWKEELINWKFGLLENYDNVPPLISFNNIPFEPKINIYCVYNGASFLVVNPLTKGVLTRLIFFAKSTQRDTSLSIYVNGEFKEKIVVVKVKDYIEGFTKFVIEDVILKPGKNEITFYDGSKIYSKRLPANANAKRGNLFVQLKEDVRFEIKSLLPVIQSTSKAKYFPSVDPHALYLIVSFDVKNSNGFFMMERFLDVDLEEYPYFDLNCIVEDPELNKIEVFFGIDFNNDGKVDGYINPQRILGTVNILDLAKSQWKALEGQGSPISYKLKCLFLLCSEKNDSTKTKGRVYALKISNLQFYCNKSMIIPLVKYQLKNLKINSSTCKTYEANIKEESSDKQILRVKAYFHGENRIFKKATKDDIPQTKESIELEAFIDIPKYDKNRDIYLSFLCALDNPHIQEINVFLGLDKNGDGVVDERRLVNQEELIELPTDSNLKKIEIKLSDLPMDVNKIKQIVFSLDKKIAIDLDNWFKFYMGEIEIFRKYPVALKTLWQRNIFLSELDSLDIPLFDIDGQRFKFSQINNKSWELFEQGVANLGKLKLQRANHRIDLLNNETFGIEWVYLEPVREKKSLKDTGQKPLEIVFRKINSSKYLVRVKGAKGPFWLVFLETFHPQWKIYLDSQMPKESFEVVKDYANLGVKEARYKLEFSPFDLRYIFAKPLTEKHFLINLYANGWYIDPKSLNLPEDFVLVLYFWPQYLFNIGLIIAGLTLCFSVVYIIFTIRKNERKFKN